MQEVSSVCVCVQCSNWLYTASSLSLYQTLRGPLVVQDDLTAQDGGLGSCNEECLWLVLLYCRTVH